MMKNDSFYLFLFIIFLNFFYLPDSIYNNPVNNDDNKFFSGEIKSVEKKEGSRINSSKIKNQNQIDIKNIDDDENGI